MHLKQNTPELQNAPLFQALVAEDIDTFNALRKKGECTSFQNAQLRGFDLRGADLVGMDFSGAYLRNTDLRGLDLRQTLLEGTSIREAKISGTFFPANIPANEIHLSYQHGTRLRSTDSAPSE